MASLRVVRHRNRIVSGSDDPWYGTPKEGTHAVLLVGNTPFSCPASQYTRETDEQLEALVREEEAP